MTAGEEATIVTTMSSAPRRSLRFRLAFSTAAVAVEAGGSSGRGVYGCTGGSAALPFRPNTSKRE